MRRDVNIEASVKVRSRRRTKGVTRTLGTLVPVGKASERGEGGVVCVKDGVFEIKGPRNEPWSRDGFRRRKAMTVIGSGSIFARSKAINDNQDSDHSPQTRAATIRLPLSHLQGIPEGGENERRRLLLAVR